VGNHCRGKRPHVRGKGELEDQSPSLITDVLAVGPIGVHPLPAHVNRVVVAGQAHAIPVDRPEGAVGRNRSLSLGEGRRGAGLRVYAGDSGRGDREHVLLTGNEKSRRWRSAASGDRAPFDQFDNPVHQHSQNGTGPGNAGDVDGRHVGNRRPEVGRNVLRQPGAASAPHPSGDVVLGADVDGPRSGIDLLPRAGLGAQGSPADDSFQRKM
jgi:hypothetical protein